MKRELTPSEVLFNIDLNEGEGDTRLKDIPKLTYGYDKVKRSVSIDKEGYNLYLIDSFSKEKIESLINYINDLYKDRKAPKDICYVVLDDPRKPEAISLSNGKGKKLKETVEDIKNSYFDAAVEFYNSSSDSEKDIIIGDIHDKRNSYIGELVEMAQKEGFDVKATSGGFAFLPLKDDDKTMTEKEYDNLSETSKDLIIEKAAKLKKRAEVVLEKLKEIEVTSVKKLKDIYREYLDIELEDSKEEFLLDFIDDDDAYEYIEKLFLNIEEGLVDIYSINIEEDEKIIDEFISKFEVSVLVDNSNYKKPRVIFEEDPSLINLIGNVEYENHNGMYKSDISLISAGSLLEANEGCIIIRLNSLILNSYSYYSLKKALLSGRLNIDSYKNYLDILSVNSLKPKSIPLDVKVILIGDFESYDILYNADEDFKKLFPLRVEFRKTIRFSDIQGKQIKNHIIERAKINNVNLSEDAVKEIIKYMSRSAGSKNKILIEDSEIDRLIVLAANDVKSDKRRLIEGTDIINVAYEEELIEEAIMEVYDEKKILLNISGSQVGSINGLAVLNTGYLSFGKPMRVTCVTCRGDGKVIDVHKESNLSGNIHEKSVNILRGLLSNLISPYEKIPVDFHLSFEQTYGTIDGDSASVAEMICMLSALSKKPVRQYIAVTGSLNQFGQVQPIGGVNEKIEGFYKTCSLMKDNKEKAVLIPSLNKEEIVLKPDVEEAVKNGSFHVYTMDTIEDAIEVMILDGKEKIDDFYKAIKKEIEKYKGKSK